MSELQFKFDEEELDDSFAQFDLSLKKKKKKKENKEKEKKDDEKREEKGEEKDDEKGEEEDYDYMFLLGRMFTMMREKNPDMSVKKRKVIPPPILEKVGTNKTMWVNFISIVQILKREPEHVQTYISSEILCESSIDANHRMIIKGKGKISSKNLETTLKKYIEEYVLCSICKGHETFLFKDPITRLSFKKCDVCKSSKSIAPLNKKICRV